jgi:signal transduction histidine kinase
MIARMKEIASRLSRAHELEFSAPEHAPHIPLSLEFRRNVMAIYKEAINNIARHANAKRIAISIVLSGNGITVEIHDDGCGFDIKAEKNGHGLRNLRNRLAELHGDFEVKSIPGAGATIKFRANFR